MSILVRPHLPSLSLDPRDGMGTGAESSLERRFRPALLEPCANPGCGSGWVRLFRRRSTPVFEDGWTCSVSCTELRLQQALRRELENCNLSSEDRHHHRIPIGLLMLERNWITREQLRKALEAQKVAGSGRLGDWLIKQHATDEATVTRALAMQWSCPVLTTYPQGNAILTSVMPRLFLDAFGALPLRISSAGLLYLGFEERLNSVLAFAVSRMTGLRIESGVVPSSMFRIEHTRILAEQFPNTQLGEAISVRAAAHMFSRAIERSQPVWSRLVRVHDCLWLRMVLSRNNESIPPIEIVRDVICSIHEA